MLEPGIELKTEFVAEDELLTDVGGTIPQPVLSTPGMISKMERTAAMAVYPHLAPGQATVGFEVAIKHVASVSVGAKCEAKASLQEIVDDRKLRFEVEVTSGGRTVGIGRHERRIIEIHPDKSR